MAKFDDWFGVMFFLLPLFIATIFAMLSRRFSGLKILSGLLFALNIFALGFGLLTAFAFDRIFKGGFF